MAAGGGSNGVRSASCTSENYHGPTGLEAVVDVVVRDLAAVDDKSQRWLAVGNGRRYARQPGRLVAPGTSRDQEQLSVMRFDRGGMGRGRPSRENNGAFSGDADQRKVCSGVFSGLAYYPHDSGVGAAIDDRGLPFIQHRDDVFYRLGHGREVNWRHAARPADYD
jgi:hypothetical protein